MFLDNNWRNKMMTGTYSHPHWEVRNCHLYGWVCAKIDQGQILEIYPFQTHEWAMLCKQSMDRHDKFLHDRMWGGSTASFVWNHQGQLTGSLNFAMTHWQLENKPIVVWDHNRQIVKFDMPALVWIWLKTTWVPKAYKRLMWGEKGKQ
jgi:hypothetical protein